MTSSPTASIKSTRRISAIWTVPILAVILGAWMLVHSYRNQGPEIEIRFSRADGIVAGKTMIKARSVDVGIVDSVYLSDDYKDVVVKARLKKEGTALLRQDTRFWVVRPRIGAGGISGIGTLFSGAYIELAPGEGKPGKRAFTGLDDRPLTPNGSPGQRVTLLGKEAGSVSAGDPVLYKGYRVGQVESGTFDPERQSFKYQVFIEAPYNELLTDASSFWNVSGMAIEADSSGIAVRAGSLETIISGGVAFDLPDGIRPGEPVTDDSEFILYPNFASINEQPYQFFSEYLLLFDTSVRGLKPGAPVEYRGLQVGSVVGVSFQYLPGEVSIAREEIPAPVLIRLDPGRLEWPDNPESQLALENDLVRRVDHGLRATLKTGSLLTGRLYVSLDFFPDAEPARIELAGDYFTLPTRSTGLEQIEQKVVTTLDMLRDLPLASMLEESEKAVKQIESTLALAETALEELSAAMKEKSVDELPDALKATLEQLRTTLSGISPHSAMYQDLGLAAARLSAALRNIEQLSETVQNRPSSLIFSKPAKSDPEPKAKRK